MLTALVDPAVSPETHASAGHGGEPIRHGHRLEALSRCRLAAAPIARLDHCPETSRPNVDNRTNRFSIPAHIWVPSKSRFSLPTSVDAWQTNSAKYPTIPIAICRVRS